MHFRDNFLNLENFRDVIPIFIYMSYQDFVKGVDENNQKFNYP